MKARDVLVVAAVAAVTAAAVLGTWAAVGNATANNGADGSLLPPAPVLEVDGVRLTLSLDQSAYQGGATPIVLLKAENLQDSPRTVEVSLKMMATEVASLESRRLPMPTQRWSNACKIALGPRETRTLEMPTATAVKAGTHGWFTLQAGGKSVNAGQFNIPGPAAKPLRPVAQATR